MGRSLAGVMVIIGDSIPVASLPRATFRLPRVIRMEPTVASVEHDSRYRVTERQPTCDDVGPSSEMGSMSPSEQPPGITGQLP